MNRKIPVQVSAEQNDADRSRFAFSSGLSLPVTADNAARLIGNGLEPPSDRLDRSESTQHVDNGRLENGRNITEEGNGGENISSCSIISAAPKHQEYRDYEARLRSYDRWTHSRPDSHSCAEAGFFFTNDRDLVRCFQCGIGLKDFCEEDEPMKEHVRHSGGCPYLREHLGESRLTELRRQLQNEDPEYNRQMQWDERGPLHSATVRYGHPEYQTLEARLSSFTGWPTYLAQTPQQLADAGLFYTGSEDGVRCFACAGGLRRWDPEDVPWTEHCRWFPACPFARQQKGDEYITISQASHDRDLQTRQTDEHGLSSETKPKTLRVPDNRATVNASEKRCLDMGYKLKTIHKAVHELENRGIIKPTIEEIIDIIEDDNTRRAHNYFLQTQTNERTTEESHRLRNVIFCMSCHRCNGNAHFLPCTHRRCSRRRICMERSEYLTLCSVCDRKMRRKFRK